MLAKKRELVGQCETRTCCSPKVEQPITFSVWTCKRSWSAREVEGIRDIHQMQMSEFQNLEKIPVRNFYRSSFCTETLMSMERAAVFWGILYSDTIHIQTHLFKYIYV